MRKSLAYVSLLILTFASVGLLPGGTAEAQSEVRIFTAALQAALEGPAGIVVHPTELNAAGSATVTLNITRTGGTITAANATFDVTLTGLNSSVILAHIHEGGPGISGPVRVDSNISPATAIPIAGGTVAFIRTNLTVSPAQAQAIINNPGGFYFNVHTAHESGWRSQEPTCCAANRRRRWCRSDSF